MFRPFALAQFCAVALSAATFTFTSSGPFALSDSPSQVVQQAATTPYPLVLNVSGFLGTTVDVIFGVDLSHTFPDDLHALLVSPTGQSLYLFGNSGGSTDMVHCVLGFSDSASGPMPDAGHACSFTYTPNSVYGSPEPFAWGTPASPYGAVFGVFSGFNPNGAWSLYAGDDAAADAGTLYSWSLTITDNTGDGEVPEPSALGLLGAGLAALALRVRLARRAE